MPYDKFVHADPDRRAARTSRTRPPVYFKILRDADAVMENTTQLFLAVRFNCNKCHDHPFERWTQDQYYQTRRLLRPGRPQRGSAAQGPEIGGTDVEGAQAARRDHRRRQERRGASTTAPARSRRRRSPITHNDLAPTTASRREQLAHWITSKDNPYFAKSYVNRLWGYLLGVGLIEPIDDIRAGNPPTNPKLLDHLTEEFIKSGFDVRHMLQLICKSRTYQHSVIANKWNEDDEINYSHALARRLPAEVLYDAIHRATGSVSRLPGLPPEPGPPSCSTAPQDVPGGFLDLFGKPPRESACECERSGAMHARAGAEPGQRPGRRRRHQATRTTASRTLLAQGEGQRQGDRGAVPRRPVPDADARRKWPPA